MALNVKSEASLVKSPISLRWPGKPQESTRTRKTTSEISAETAEKPMSGDSDHSVKSGVSFDGNAQPFSRTWPVVPEEKQQQPPPLPPLGSVHLTRE